MKEVLQIAYLRHLQDFYLFESVKDGIISKDKTGPKFCRIFDTTRAPDFSGALAIHCL